MITTVERVANSVWLQAVERLLTLAVAALLAVVLYVGKEKSDTLVALEVSVTELAMTVKVITERQNVMDAAVAESKREIQDIKDDLDASRRVGQNIWDDFRERLARLETQTTGLIKTADKITEKLDSISDRLPRREGLFEKKAQQ